MKKVLSIILLAFIIISIVPSYAQETKVTAIEAGDETSFALINDGTVWAWGYNLYDQLGNSNIICLENVSNMTDWISGVPVQSNITNVKEISASGTATAALKNDGTVWSWGHFSDGQMGNGEQAEYNPYDASIDSSTNTPIKADINNVKEVSAGDEFTLALKNDGTAWEWGSGGLFTDYNLLNKENYSDPIAHITFLWSPSQVSGLSNITDVESGHDHAVALDGEGSVWMWGDNITNNDSDDPGIISTPIQIPVTNVKAITAGSGFSLALKNDGTVWGWGDDTLGELGDGGSFSLFTAHSIVRSTPVMVQGLTNVIAISSRDALCIALKNDGTVWEWGRIDSGTVYTTPSQVPIDNVVAIASGTSYGLALKSDGIVWSWGSNTVGELGIGTYGDESSTPVQVHLDIIPTMNTSTIDKSGSQVNNIGNPGNTLSNMVNPTTVIALIAMTVIACGIAYYMKKNR